MMRYAVDVKSSLRIRYFCNVLPKSIENNPIYRSVIKPFGAHACVNSTKKAQDSGNMDIGIWQNSECKSGLRPLYRLYLDNVWLRVR